MTFKFGLWSGNFWNHKVLTKSKMITTKSLNNHHIHKISIILTIYKLVKLQPPLLLHKNRVKVHTKHHRRNHKMNLPIFRLFPKQTTSRKLNFKPLNKRMKPPRALSRRVNQMFDSAFWALCSCSISFSINSFLINLIDFLLTQFSKSPCPGISVHVNLDGNRSCDLA